MKIGSFALFLKLKEMDLFIYSFIYLLYQRFIV